MLCCASLKVLLILLHCQKAISLSVIVVSNISSTVMEDLLLLVARVGTRVCKCVAWLVSQWKSSARLT